MSDTDKTLDTGTDEAETGTDETGTDDSTETLDVEKAKAKIHKANREAANLRARLKELEDKAGKYDEIENEKKSDLQRETEAREAAEKKAAELESRILRMEVASERGLTAGQAKFLTGATKADLEAAADELLAAFKGSSSSDSDKPNRPGVDNLRGGSDPSDDTETDPYKIAAAIRGNRR